MGARQYSRLSRIGDNAIELTKKGKKKERRGEA